jgi:hypothetical protein
MGENSDCPAHPIQKGRTLWNQAAEPLDPFEMVGFAWMDRSPLRTSASGLGELGIIWRANVQSEL